MKTVLALVLATAVGARAEEARPAPHHGSDSGLVLLDFFLDVVTLGLEVAAIENAAHAQPPPPQPQMTQRAPAQEEDDLPPRAFRARRPQAREGLLLSFGIGGGSMFVSYPNDGRTGAFDLDMRLGYGFSDRFQLFMDLDLAGAHYAYGDDIGSWAFTPGRGERIRRAAQFPLVPALKAGRGPKERNGTFRVDGKGEGTERERDTATAREPLTRSPKSSPSTFPFPFPFPARKP
ncbi:MAG: hypothetical protein LC689_18330 [Myxococcales bacterium]|nr:hypothetical protein [Myxococcales bacterium]